LISSSDDDIFLIAVVVGKYLIWSWELWTNLELTAYVLCSSLHLLKVDLHFVNVLGVFPEEKLRRVLHVRNLVFSRKHGTQLAADNVNTSDFIQPSKLPPKSGVFKHADCPIWSTFWQLLCCIMTTNANDRKKLPKTKMMLLTDFCWI